MPVILDSPDLFAPSKNSKISPKYFEKALTGEGKNRGLISSSLRPRAFRKNETVNTLPHDLLHRKARNTSGQITQHMIPMGPLTQYSIEANGNGQLFDVPVPEQMLQLTDPTDRNFNMWFNMSVQGIAMTEDASSDTIERTLNVLYRMEVWSLQVGDFPEQATYDSLKSWSNHVRPRVYFQWSFAPLSEAEDFINKELNRNYLKPVDTTKLHEWLSEYDVYEAIVDQAEIWSTDAIAELLTQHIEHIFKTALPQEPDSDTLNRLAAQLRYLESYQVTLDAYQILHRAITTHAPTNIANELVKQNLNLLMSHTLYELDQHRTALPTIKQNGAMAQLPPWLSTQQRNAIATEAPLVLVQAGAGVGKSTVILERIDYMVNSGIDPKDITVLSFTNAAADNIKAKNPGVNSMTTASMIHDIYSLNYPEHELSSIDTIINSLEIYYPTDDIAMTFRRRLMELQNRSAFPGGTTALNAFVERFQKEIISMLDKLRQTCLELEIILAYQLIDSMIEPAHVKSKFLIVDEVQDNSVFEFIYTLKYTAKHKENLYLVGDSAQTLYEFRASNPKALNALEASKVFETYPLTTNYRSNQAILDFANRTLAGIEANHYAKILLQANSLAQITPEEFTKNVTLDYRKMPSPVSTFRANLPAYMKNVFKPWIDGCLARGEQVAFLAFDRATVSKMQQTLTEMYPHIEVANLVSQRAYSTTVFSQFIKSHWDGVTLVPSLDQAPSAVVHGIQNHLHQLTRDAAKAGPAIMRMVTDWWTSSRDAISSWVMLNRAGALSEDAFFERLKRNLLDYEISHNAIKQSLLNQKNKEQKEKNLNSKAQLVVSTIHGVKGLEFDNVAVMYRYDSQMDEAAKRMYYVALTRAINTEYIFAYGSLTNPKIVSDYDSIMVELLNQVKIKKLREEGNDLDNMSDDEVENALALLEARAKQAYDEGKTEEALELSFVPPKYATTGADLPIEPEEDQN